MSLITQAFIVEKYGLRLNAEKLAEVLGITKPALYNQISAGTCPVKTYIEAGKRWADYRDVSAAFADAFRQAREQRDTFLPQLRAELAARRTRKSMELRRASNARRYAAKRVMTWADRDAIRRVYAEARALSEATGVPHHVDHIIPLQGDLVSGLHVESNLRVLPATDNQRKRNRYEVE